MRHFRNYAERKRKPEDRLDLLKQIDNFEFETNHTVDDLTYVYHKL